MKYVSGLLYSFYTSPSDGKHYENATLLGREHLARLAHRVVLAHVDDAVLQLHGETQLLELLHHAVGERHLALRNDEVLRRLESRAGKVQRLVLLEELQHLLLRLVGEEQSAVPSQHLSQLTQIVAVLLLGRSAQRHLHDTVLAKEEATG